jgi:hypothetical protein
MEDERTVDDPVDISNRACARTLALAQTFFEASLVPRGSPEAAAFQTKLLAEVEQWSACTLTLLAYFFGEWCGGVALSYHSPLTPRLSPTPSARQNWDRSPAPRSK